LEVRYQLDITLPWLTHRREPTTDLPVASPGFDLKNFFKNWSKAAMELALSENGGFPNFFFFFCFVLLN